MPYLFSKIFNVSSVRSKPLILSFGISVCRRVLLQSSLEWLQEMQPSVLTRRMKLKPIRLCGACYPQSPCHKIEWQFKTATGCDGVPPRKLRHQLMLLSECPHCVARFKIPALWVDGWCPRCFMTFAERAKYQKPREILKE